MVGEWGGGLGFTAVLLSSSQPPPSEAILVKTRKMKLWSRFGTLFKRFRIIGHPTLTTTLLSCTHAYGPTGLQACLITDISHSHRVTPNTLFCSSVCLKNALMRHYLILLGTFVKCNKSSVHCWRSRNDQRLSQSPSEPDVSYQLYFCLWKRTVASLMKLPLLTRA